MMSCNCILMLLIVFLSTIDVSKGGCADYFSIKNLEEDATHIIPVVKTKDLKDAMECSIERDYLEKTNKSKHQVALLRCFNRTKPEAISDKCKGDTFQNITLYHFMCLTAKALQKDIGHTACELDTVLEIYSAISKGFGQTTTLSTTTTTAPTTTLPERTTAPTTTLPERTTAPTTTLPERTTAPTTTTATTTAATTTTATTTTVLSPTTTTTTTTVLSPTTTTTTTVLSPTTTTTTTTTVTQSTVSGITEVLPPQHIVDEHTTSSTDLSRTLLVISLTLNVVLPLAVYLYMRRHSSQDYGLPVNTGMCELNEVSTEDRPGAEMEPRSQPAPVNSDGEEASHLMQASECDSVVTQ